MTPLKGENDELDFGLFARGNGMKRISAKPGSSVIGLLRLAPVWWSGSRRGGFDNTEGGCRTALMREGRHSDLPGRGLRRRRNGPCQALSICC
jgi:hypothetical protein